MSASQAVSALPPRPPEGASREEWADWSRRNVAAMLAREQSPEWQEAQRARTANAFVRARFVERLADTGAPHTGEALRRLRGTVKASMHQPAPRKRGRPTGSGRHTPPRNIVDMGALPTMREAVAHVMRMAEFRGRFRLLTLAQREALADALAYELISFKATDALPWAQKGGRKRGAGPRPKVAAAFLVAQVHSHLARAGVRIAKRKRDAAGDARMGDLVAFCEALGRYAFASGHNAVRISQRTLDTAARVRPAAGN